MCQAVFTAGVQWQVFEQEVSCVAWPVAGREEEEPRDVEGDLEAVGRPMGDGGAEVDVGGGGGEEEVQEIIAEHPVR